MAHFCIITGEEITQQNNSRAHVIPSALGGPLKPWNILSRDGNSLLGETIDLRLIEAFQPLMSLINGSRDRGENQPVRMTDENGRVVMLEFGEPLKLARTEYNEEPIAEGWKIQINARNLKELRTHLGRVRSKLPTFDIDEAMKSAVEKRDWPNGYLNTQLEFGSARIFPAVFVAASVFAKHHGIDPHPGLKAFVDSFDPDKTTLPPDTFFFMPDREWFSAPGEITHIVVLYADAAAGKLLVCMQLFNLMTVGVVLPYKGTVDKTETYAVDILTGAETPVSIDAHALNGVTWAETHRNGEPSLLQHVSRQFGAIGRIAGERSFKHSVENLTNEVFGVGDTPIPGALTAMLGKLKDLLLHEWERPYTSVAVREENLQSFNELSRKFGQMVPTNERPSYRDQFILATSELRAAVETAKNSENGDSK